MVFPTLLEKGSEKTRLRHVFSVIDESYFLEKLVPSGVTHRNLKRLTFWRDNEKSQNLPLMVGGVIISLELY